LFGKKITIDHAQSESAQKATIHNNEAENTIKLPSPTLSLGFKKVASKDLGNEIDYFPRKINHKASSSVSPTYQESETGLGSNELPIPFFEFSVEDQKLENVPLSKQKNKMVMSPNMNIIATQASFEHSKALEHLQRGRYIGVVSPIYHPNSQNTLPSRVVCRVVNSIFGPNNLPRLYIYHPWYLPQICETTSPTCETLIVPTLSHANIPHSTSLIQSSVQGYHLEVAHLPATLISGGNSGTRVVNPTFTTHSGDALTKASIFKKR
jgi:hypothetical protein